ncbi:MAG: hypothetical protein BGO57_03895 [Sphingomonadales bacterium 63-6]|nr:MAG: hypothetical protein BGO57_03895 [Sphingomonadales bacterium 63-6]
MTLPKPILAIAGSFLLLSPTSADACIIFTPAKLEQIRQADVVFTGDIVSYDILEHDGPFFPTETGLITVKVRSTIKGTLPPAVRLTWYNSTFELPSDLLAFRPAILAATYGGSDYPRGPNLPDAGNPSTDNLILFQPPCSSEFILPHSSAGEEVVRRVLNGGSATFTDLGASTSKVRTVELKAIRRSESPHGVFSGVLAVAFAFLTAGLAMVWRKRRKHPA